MVAKRKAPPPLELALRYDDRLTAVTRALDNLKRTGDGAALASGAFDAFPLPVLRLAGDATDLPLPLTPLAVVAIAQRASTSFGQPLVVESHDIVLRNPRWAGFVDKMVASIREPLGITDAAQLNTTLKQVVLVQTGGRLPVGRSEGGFGLGQKPGCFGSLVIVLPGAFSGGDVTITGGRNNNNQAQRWSPGRTDCDAFDLGYAAFYNGVDRVDAAPVTSGHALCVVYDLATTTLHELPRYAGAQVLEAQVQTTLANFFVSPSPPTKRTKISKGAWQTIDEFTREHRLVFPVRMWEDFDDLQGDEEQLLGQLFEFCDRSNGDYELYSAAIHGISWKKPLDKKKETTYSFHIRAPWRRYGDVTELSFATTKVDHRLELAPAGFIEMVAHRRTYCPSDLEEEDDPYRAVRYISSCEGNFCMLQQQRVLVVQRATSEHVFWAHAPTDKVLERLNVLLATDPSKASRILRRFLLAPAEDTRQSGRRLFNDPTLDDSCEDFAPFMDIVIALNNLPLFCDLLRAISGLVYDDTTIPRAVHHFGLEACMDTIEDVLQTPLTFRSRVNFVCSVLRDISDLHQINRLTSKLATLFPWAGRAALDCVTDLYDARKDEYPTVEEFTRLVRIAYQCSPATLETLLGETNAGSFTVQVLTPSLSLLIEGVSNVEKLPLLSVLRSLHAAINSSLPVLHNAHYARLQLPQHCDKCREIRAFLVSPSKETMLTVKNSTERKHVEAVVKRQIQRAGPMVAEAETPATIRLTKQSSGNRFSEDAERGLESLSALLKTIPDNGDPPRTASRRGVAKARRRAVTGG